MARPAEDIKERLSITDVVGAYVELERAGKNLKARCPFHSERTPSFVVSPDRGTYYCFGCGAKGDIFSFVEAFEGLDFRGALQQLADRAGVELVQEDPARRDRRERLYALLEAATQFFTGTLHETPHALTYVRDTRGITDASAAYFRIGYAPAAWHATAEHLRDKGFSDTELADAGITKASSSGRTYDAFRGRIMFPIMDAAGRVVAFSGRDLDSHGGDPDRIPKYVNSPETELYTKSKLLYAFDKAKTAIRKYNFAIIAEGQLDVILAHQAGFPNTVGLSGTALTHEQLTHLSRLSENVVCAFDTDAAGVAAAARSALRALALGMDVKVADIPDELDPADLIHTQGTDAWRAAIRNATHIIDVERARVRAAAADDRAFRKAVSEQVLPLVAAIPNRLDQSHFVKAIAGQLGVTDDVIYTELAQHTPETFDAVPAETPPERQAAAGETHTPKPARREQLTRLLIGILTWQEAEAAPAIDTASVAEQLANMFGEETFAELRENMKPEYEALQFQAEEHTRGVADLATYVAELLADLRAEIAKAEYASVMADLRAAEQAGDAETAETLRSRCQELLRTLGSIHERR